AHVVLLSTSGNNSIHLNDGVENALVESKGRGYNLRKIEVSTSADIDIIGENKSPFSVNNSADGTTITTEIDINVHTSEPMTLDVLPGAENTTVSRPSGNTDVNINGVGVIEVTNTSTNTVEDIPASYVAGLIGAKGAISGRVTELQDDGSTKPVNNVKVEVYTAESLGLGSSVASTRTNANGDFNMTGIPYGNYIVIASKGNMTENCYTTLSEPSINVGELVLIDHTKGKGNLSGVLKDARTGRALTNAKGIKLKIRTGQNNKFGNNATVVEVDENGRYQINNLHYGVYTIQVEDLREGQDELGVRTEVVVRIVKHTTVQDITVNMQSESEEEISGGVGELRFVMEWGDEESGASSDIDSHLIGPRAESDEYFHIYYAYGYDNGHSDNRAEYWADGEIQVALDVDDVEFVGPETTTVYRETMGVYHYYLYNYSADQSIIKSNPVVSVYRGDKKIKSYTVPSIGTGDEMIWDVCTYDTRTNTITSINKVVDSSDLTLDGNTVGNWE
ncbi:MAG: carboxypeptidase regulatory-like domain-containing protein, partial [Lachnospiraceae bacterium]|nr:carboxypeptidase regulatory-like domain-containing protein [Lachnospiraceae bacterium]